MDGMDENTLLLPWGTAGMVESLLCCALCVCVGDILVVCVLCAVWVGRMWMWVLMSCADISQPLTFFATVCGTVTSV